MKANKKITLCLMLVVVLVSLLALAISASADTPTDAMQAILEDDELMAYRQGETQTLATDGYIGIPVELNVFYSGDEAEPSYQVDSTPIILYVVNTGVERIGLKSDTEIIASMLDRGYIVITLDYKNSSRATVSEGLDYSAHELSRKARDGAFFNGLSLFPKGSYYNTFVVPAGYDISLYNVYWEIDKHSTDGTLEKIVNVWNNDFRGWYGEDVIKWVDENGVRKPTQNGFDGSEPVWLDAQGNVDENGDYIRIKHTCPEVVTDCVKPDGSPLDLNLYMNLIYPTGGKEVPALVHASSSSHLASCIVKRDQPYLVTALFSGYAGVAYDHGYVPMARDDHYGYFDGAELELGGLTGDNNTYSLHFYNNNLIDTAAMRYIRYASLESADMEIDIDAIGVFGNSKGGWMPYLGEEDPTLLPPRRIFEGHYGETRYENGKTADEGIIDGGEEQPWLEYNGVRLESGADLIYASCGGVIDGITSGHAPTFITCNMQDYLSSYYSSSNTFVNVCRTMDIPTLWFEADIGHQLGDGEDYHYGVDIYRAFFDFCDYWLKGEAVKVVYISSDIDYAGLPGYSPITVKFTGSVDESELDKITLTYSGGVVEGYWTSAFGRTEWTFQPTGMLGNTEYTLTVPAGLKGENGTPMAQSATYSFTTGYEQAEGFTTLRGERGTYLYYTLPESLPEIGVEVNRYLLRLLIGNEASNTAEIYTLTDFDPTSPDTAALGSLADSVPLSGGGYVELDLGELISSHGAGDTIAFLVKNAYDVGVNELCNISTAEELEKIAYADNMDWEITVVPDGSETEALMLPRMPLNENYENDYFHNGLITRSILANYYVIGTQGRRLSEADMGRRFTVTFRVYDTISRYISVHMKGCTSEANECVDYNQDYANFITKAGEWVTISLEYVVDEPLMFGSLGCFTQAMTVKSYGTGDVDAPIYFTDFITTETVSNIEIDCAELVYTSTEQRADPLATPYGSIPEKWADTEKYPFVIFDTEGNCVFATDIWGEDNLEGVLGYVSQQKTVSYTAYLRRDYTYSSTSVYNNLSFLHGSLTIDLGGNSLVDNSTHGYGLILMNAKSSASTAILIRNGEIILSDSPLATYRGANMAIYDYANQVKEFSLKLEQVSISFAEGATATSIFNTNSTSGAPLITDTVLENCDIDLTNSADGLTLAVMGDTKGYVTSRVSVKGGSIKGDDLSSFSLYTEKNKLGGFELAKSADGRLLTLYVADGGKAIDGAFNIGGVDYCYVGGASNGGYTVYTLEVDELWTPYGSIPSEYGDTDAYPFAIFVKTDEGYSFSAVTADAFADNESTVTAHLQGSVVIYMRRDFTLNNHFNNFGRYKDITFDLGGHRLNNGGFILVYNPISEYNVSACIKNGEIINSAASTPIIRFGKSKATACKSASLYCEDVTFTNATVNSSYLFTYHTFKDAVTFSVELVDCVYDLGEGTQAQSLFVCGKTSGPTTMTVRGGEIIAPAMVGLNITAINESSSSVVFERSGDEYTTLLIPTGSSATELYLNTGDGERLKYGLDKRTTEGDLYRLFNPVTPYGEIGAAYAGVVDYPFVVFGADGSFIGGYPVLFGNTAGDLSVIAMHAAREAGDGAVILMRRDYIYTDSVSYPNIGNNAGARILDLGGYTLYDRHTYNGGLLTLIAKSSNKATTLTVQNGSIYLSSSPLVSFGELNATIDGVSHSLVLRDLYIGLEKGATTSYLLSSVANPTLDIRYSISLEDCTLDYTEAKTGLVLMAKGSKDGALEVHATNCSFVGENAIDSDSIIPKMSLTLYNSFIYNVYIPAKSNLSYIVLDGVVYSELSELPLRAVDGELCYVLSLPVAVTSSAAELELCVAITLEGGDEAKGYWQISAVGHLADLIEAEEGTVDALAKDALAYIRSAYVYAEENEAELARVKTLIDGIIGESFAESSLPDTTLTKANSTDGLYSAALRLGAETSFLFCIDEGYDVEKYNIHIGDFAPECEVYTDNGRVYIEVKLYAYQMTETISYSIEGTDIVGEYNLRAYYDFALEYGDETLVDLVTRLWRYAELAGAYYGECCGEE